jgi:hypothetical protein
VNRTRDKFLARAGFTGDENCGVARSDFSDTQEHGLESRRGPDNLFEHGSPIDFLTQRNVFPLGSLLRPLVIVNVCSNATPACYSPSFVAKGIQPIQKPAEIAIVPTHSHFLLKGPSVLKGFMYPFLKRRYVFGMGNKIKKFHWIFSRNGTEIVERCAVSVRDTCVCFPDEHVDWRDINDLL